MKAGRTSPTPFKVMSQNFVIFPKTAATEQQEAEVPNQRTTSSSSKHLQSLKFNVATRRLPLLVFWIFMGVAVMVAGALAHNRTSWQAFWNQEAVLNRLEALTPVPLGLFFDALAARINRVFVKGGWIVAGTLIILVQAFYLFLVTAKRDRSPSLRFIRNFNLKEMASIEFSVLFLGTIYFLLCTWTFNLIAGHVGSCTVESRGTFTFPTTKSTCKSSQGTFRGFDISGHCFLIVHSCLLALEYAAKLLYVWHAKEQSHPMENGKDSDIESLSDQPDLEVKSNDIFNRNYFALRLILILLLSGVFLLCATEFLVFLQTILFYHTVLEKIIGTFIGAWFWIALFLLSLTYPHLF